MIIKSILLTIVITKVISSQNVYFRRNSYTQTNITFWFPKYTYGQTINIELVKDMG